MTASFRTLKATCLGEFQSKQSKFIGLLIPVSSEEAVKSALMDLKKAHPKANHICYGYRIQGQLLMERMSDDGEPTSTAGLPILEVLRGAELENILGVVVRYFGGTLLGTGGLIRAYTKGIQAALEQGYLNKQIVEQVWMLQVSVLVAYPLSGKVEFELKAAGFVGYDSLYADQVTYLVPIPLGDETKFMEQVTAWTNGTGLVETLGKQQVVRPI